MREPYRSGEYEGFRYQDVPPALAELLPEWLARGEVEDGERLLGGDVFRHGIFVAKFFPTAGRLRDRFRASRAVRSADLALGLAGIPTPAPYVALGHRRRGARRPDLLVMEAIDGVPLSALWREDAAAMEAFPSFLAAIARRRILLGDFHLHNALWDGARWVLLDLDGIRHGLHAVSRRRLLEVQWARVWISVAHDALVFDMFRSFLAEAGLGWNAERAWRRITRRGEGWGRGHPAPREE